MAQAQAEQQRKGNWFSNYLNVAMKAKATLNTAQKELNGIETTLALILPQMLAVQEQAQEIGMKVDTGWSYGAVKALETARRVLKRNGSKGLPRATQLVCDVHSDFFDILRELRLNAEAEAEPGASESHIRRIAHQKEQAGEKLGEAGEIGRPLNALQGTFVELEQKYKLIAHKVASNQLTPTEKFILSFHEKITTWRSKSNAPVEPAQDINPIPAAVVQQKPVASSSAALSPAPVAAATPSATDVLELVPQGSAISAGDMTVNPETPAVAPPRMDGVLESAPHDYGYQHSDHWTKLSTQLMHKQFRKRNLAVVTTVMVGMGVALMAVMGLGNKKPVVASSAGPVRAAVVARPLVAVTVQPQANEVVMPEQQASVVEEIKPSAVIPIVYDSKKCETTFDGKRIHAPIKGSVENKDWAIFNSKYTLYLSAESPKQVRDDLSTPQKRQAFRQNVFNIMNNDPNNDYVDVCNKLQSKIFGKGPVLPKAIANVPQL